MSAVLGVFILGAGPAVGLAAPQMVVPGVVFLLMHGNAPLLGFLL
jgi:hypothetical protein